MNSFLSNSYYRVTFSANNIETANMISQLVGNKTATQESHNKPKFIDFNPASRTMQVSETQRALLLPQEVIQLPRDEQIILVESFSPIKCKRFSTSRIHSSKNACCPRSLYRFRNRTIRAKRKKLRRHHHRLRHPRIVVTRHLRQPRNDDLLVSESSMIASSSNRHGFMLIEFAVVIVVLGLIAAGILQGHLLIRSVQLQALLMEEHKFESAITTFRDQYAALPGDMPNAYQYWGAACGTNATTPYTGCNGDGNQWVEPLPSGEVLKAWRHLFLAGLVNGVNSGIINPVIPTTNVALESRFPQTIWFIDSDWSFAGHPSASADGGLYLVAAASPPDQRIPSLTLGEALMLDQKSDDGHANTGRMRGGDGGLSTVNCADNGSDNYNLHGMVGGAKARGLCLLTFILQEAHP